MGVRCWWFALYLQGCIPLSPLLTKEKLTLIIPTYCVLYLDKEKGTLDGRTERKKYFIMNKKIYSKRFSTDCFSDYFNDLARKTKVGLNDYVEYATEKATIEELKLQHSYFIDGLYKTADSN